MNKVGMILTKIMEVFHWVGAALMAAATVCAVAAPQWVGLFVGFDGKECCGVDLTVYGYEMNLPLVNGTVDMKAFAVFGIGAVLVLALVAMVCRNLSQIFKSSEGTSPFQQDNIRRMREIGIFAIAMPVVSLLMSIVARLVLGAEGMEISVDMGGLVMGIIVLCLTRFFVHGAQLEQDVDGLV